MDSDVGVAARDRHDSGSSSASSSGSHSEWTIREIATINLMIGMISQLALISDAIKMEPEFDYEFPSNIKAPKGSFFSVYGAGGSSMSGSVDDNSGNQGTQSA
jgi:hypothetical protein